MLDVKEMNKIYSTVIMMESESRNVIIKAVCNYHVADQQISNFRLDLNKEF